MWYSIQLNINIADYNTVNDLQKRQKERKDDFSHTPALHPETNSILMWISNFHFTTDYN
jgi:hypothetical protein